MVFRSFLHFSKNVVLNTLYHPYVFICIPRLLGFICILLVCIRMLYPYVSVCCPYVTRRYSYVPACIRVLLVCYPHVTNVRKRVMHVQSCCFANQSQPIAFLPFLSPRPLRKLPILELNLEMVGQDLKKQLSLKIILKKYA